MIVTGEMILDSYVAEGRLYNNPRMKLSRDVKEGKYIRLKKDLYETDPNAPSIGLAQAIYGPSYISFDYALSYYGMIPEYARNVTCATFGKHKNKRFDTNFCSFLYTDVPKKVFNEGRVCVKLDNYSFWIATREKALCDKLYKLSPAENMVDFEELILDDLRVDEDCLMELNFNEIGRLSGMYGCRNVSMLYHYLTPEGEIILA